MFRISRNFLVFLFVALQVLLPLQVGRADEGDWDAPPGFNLLFSQRGVELFKKEYPNGTPDYVQVIDLGSGAGFKLMHAPIAEPRVGKGVYGDDDPRFTLQPLNTFWREAGQAYGEIFCVSNGSFFYMVETPTRLAFPLKLDGKVVTDGFGSQQYPDQKLMLELWADRAEINPFSAEALHSSSAPDIIAGLSEEANKRIKNSVGRTFVGVVDGDGDGVSEVILLLNTQTGYQSAVADVLRAFGAEAVMMLDGGGSTQLLCQGKNVINSDRPIPQALAVLPAPPLPVSASAPDRPIWIMSVVGQAVQFEMALTNTGIETWQPGAHTFIVEESALGSQQELPFEHAVAPGEQVTLLSDLMPYTDAGLFPVQLEWRIAGGAKSFEGEPIDLRIVALPADLASQQEQLRDQIETWSLQGDEQTQAQVGAWLEQHTGMRLPEQGGPLQVSFRDLIWVPAIMLPFVLVVAAYLLRLQQAGE
jgi:hypothetical protein